MCFLNSPTTNMANMAITSDSLNITDKIVNSTPTLISNTAEAVNSILDNVTELSFLEINQLYDGTIISISINTYDVCKRKIQETIKDKVSVIYHDTKKRKPTTLQKINLTQADIDNGKNEYDMYKDISDYCILHKCPIISIDVASKINKINNHIEKNRLKKISNVLLDLKLIAKKCDETMPKVCNLEKMRELFFACEKRYKSIEKISHNKKACILNYAYYWQNEKRKSMEWLICVTSIGKIYYDIFNETWGITKKEKEATGLIIESFDINDIKMQLFKKYRVNSMAAAVDCLYTKRRSN